jgi:hypothetical protein
VVLFVYQICRLLFYFFNRNAFENITAKGFLGGIHFDLSAIAYINLVFALFHFIPGNFKYKPNYQKYLKIGFFIVNFIFILTNFVDFEYFNTDKGSVDKVAWMSYDNFFRGNIRVDRVELEEFLLTIRC